MDADKNQIITLVLDDSSYETLVTPKFARRKAWVPPDPSKILAAIPGTIQEIYVKEGQEVSRGQPLLQLEAMKMVNDVLAVSAGVIKSIAVTSGQTVGRLELLVELENPKG